MTSGDSSRPCTQAPGMCWCAGPGARLTREGVTLSASREQQSCSVSHGGVAGAEGEAAKEAREDGTESDSDDDDDEKLDWMALVGERAEKAPWLRSQAVVAAASFPSPLQVAVAAVGLQPS